MKYMPCGYALHPSDQQSQAIPCQSQHCENTSATQHTQRDTLRLTVPRQLLPRRVEIHARRSERKQPNSYETDRGRHRPRMHTRPRQRTQRRRQLVRQEQDRHGQQKHMSRYVMSPA